VLPLRLFVRKRVTVNFSVSVLFSKLLDVRFWCKFEFRDLHFRMHAKKSIFPEVQGNCGNSKYKRFERWQVANLFIYIPWYLLVSNVV